ncbi:DUF5694 domain-containing protein [Hymenobacter endophyticus]|uniref:DUF5694 domain-containing protein n=1 Tax=Hymenobacter endophyticus TaxID=3076335 RepID=A0ABU3TEP1_9BACT|nr:DUF5694 domain-containing protein [Hymenobacter endophyticus]MDU0369842.1 DUF5694 domain-containing protein [Hymenobacter endophyticus]
MLLSPLHHLLFCLLLVLPLAARSQSAAPLEVVVVASSHVNSGPAANFRPVIEKLKAYQPDMIFGEYTSATELKQLPADNYASRMFLPRRQFVQQRNPKARPLAPHQMEKARQALAGFPYYHKTRMDLARSYVLGFDRANAEYQLYLLHQEMKPRFGAQELAYFNTVFGGSDSLRQRRLVRPTSEYHKIFFPLAYELKHAQIYPMDCQLYDIAWSTAWGQAAEQVAALQARVKLDSTSAEAATWRRMKAANAAYENYGPATNTPLAVYQALNAPAYAQVDEPINFYGGVALYGAPGFPTEEVKGMKAQWLLRNQGMCANVVRLARQQGARRVVVAVGASHGQLLSQLLRETTGVKVLSFNDLP